MMMPSIFGENLFDDFFDTVSRPIKAIRQNTIPQVMRTDVKESDKGFTLDIDLPGYKKEDISAELKDGYLTVSAKTNEEKEEKEEDGTYIRRERTFGSCSRSFYIGEDIEETEVKAKFEDGILKVFVPKKEIEPKVEERKYISIEG
ncbi:MAG: Hsp20/alpha crystallin family protein [Lachnospiraceae bacterium]|nr:Hsp20/alpha crystallin family protein [Lachnospiraceae bacterium]